jgi:drug/metabolite transporter (DMT)-like permease
VENPSPSPQQPSESVTKSYLVLVLGIIAVSLSAIIIRLAQSESIPSMLIAAGRLTIAALILAPFALRKHKAEMQALSRSDLVLVIGAGLFLALHFILWIPSLEYTSVLISVVLITTTPLWSVLLEAIFLKSRVGKLVLVGLLTAIAGGVLISIPPETEGIELGSNPALGIALSLGGAIAVSVYMVIGRKMRSRLAVLPYIWLVYSFAAAFALIVVLVMGIPILGYSATGYLLVLALAIVPQLIGHSAFNYVLQNLSATYVGVATQLEPAVTGVIAYFMFEEVPTENQLIGSAIILTGVVLASIGQARTSARNITE